MSKCPGQDSQQWGFDAIYDVECPKCHVAVEFFKDEVKHRCKRCGEVVFNERMDLGCAKWCPSAASCVGPENVKALELTEQKKRRREDFRMLLESVPEADQGVRELFMALYSEYAAEDKLFDTNRLYTIQERDPQLFDRASGAFRAFLAEKAAIAEREAQSRARTEELLKHDQRKKVIRPEVMAENGP
jgi:hypothetical protein